MPKLNYKIIIPLFVLGLIVAYFIFAYNYVFYKIGQGGLTFVDMQKVYVLNEKLNTSDKVVYAALGDSLTAGAGASKYEESWPYLVAQKLAGDSRRVVLTDFAVPGYRTDDLLNVLVDPALNSKPDVVTLLIGTNDIYSNVSAEEFAQNYRAILEKLKSAKTKVYLISIPFIGSSSIILPAYSSYSAARITKFNNIINNFAKEYGFAYIDIATPTKNLLKTDGTHYSADAFHPSASGYALFANLIYDHLNY
ncbi:MAG: SGNH/GDSL hydrolase family protein [Candidatus Falkowbacteria bacterium]